MTSPSSPCDLPPEADPRIGAAFWQKLCWDLRNYQTVLTLASEALTQQPAGDRHTQQRLHRMQLAISESHKLLEALLQIQESREPSPVLDDDSHPQTWDNGQRRTSAKPWEMPNVGKRF